MKPQVIEQRLVARLLPKRPCDSHKGMFGTVVVIGGASGMTGAALLASRAALKLGAGCVHAVLLADNAPCVDFIQPELMLHNAASTLPHATVLLTGCGMGTNALAQKLLVKALHHKASLVLDADALNLISMHSELRRLLIARKIPAVLTPHPAEAARLLSCTTAQVQKDRIGSVQQLAEMFNCSVVLKGANSLCATHDKKLYVNHTGNPGMSAPGMGDVLAGMIVAFIAQGLNIDNALLLAVHLHGVAGDELAKQCAIGMTATELTDQARLLLNTWQSN